MTHYSHRILPEPPYHESLVARQCGDRPASLLHAKRFDPKDANGQGPPSYVQRPMSETILRLVTSPIDTLMVRTSCRTGAKPARVG